MTAALEHRRIRAPRGHGQALIEPPLATAADLLANNRDLIAGQSLQIAGKSMQEFAVAARSEFVAAAHRYTARYRTVPDAAEFSDRPIILSGHQPELFHPGVWFKNFALSKLGRELNATAINFLVDNDTIGAPAIRVPVRSAANYGLQSVEFDRPGDAIPYEQRPVLDRHRFASFGERVLEVYQGFAERPLIEDLWPLAMDAAQRRSNLGHCLAEGRHRLEADFGLCTLEIPLSEICQTPHFLAFVCEVLKGLPEFRETYNTSLAEYRQVHHLRSHSHPVPDLAANNDWLEAPFWIWTNQKPRRNKLWARHTAAGWELGDGENVCATVDLSNSSSASEQLRDQLGEDIKLRPRALTTTMYVRMVLGDLFLHGIGGAKYDQLTDVIIQRFFRWRPPAYFTMSATALLVPDRTDALRDELRYVTRLQRELRYHPEKHLDGSAGVEELISEKKSLIFSEPPRGQRRARHHGIERINLALQPYLEATRQRLAVRRQRLTTDLHQQRLLASREFSFCLFPSDSLPNLLLEISSQRA